MRATNSIAITWDWESSSTSTLRGARLRAAFIAFIIFALFGSIVLVLWSGAQLLQQGEITFGDLTRFILYTTFVAGAMGQFAELYSQLQKADRSHAAGSGDCSGKPAKWRPALAPRRRPLCLGLEVMWYSRMSTSPILRARESKCFTRSILAPAPDKESRSSARAAPANPPSSPCCCASMIRPPAGLLIDGRDARDYRLTELRGQMSMVPQEVLLFGGSIAENIAYGKPGASTEEIEHAARQANAHEFIQAFPEGYATLVGDRGIKLSGGQRQRVAIARAILKNPAILILDEATSSLDSESERLIQEALETLMRGRTSFIIAHRLATVRHADRIIVISDGRVVESGTHEELQAMKTAFTDAWPRCNSANKCSSETFFRPFRTSRSGSRQEPRAPTSQ